MCSDISIASCFFENLWNQEINNTNAVFRLLLALVAGALVGLERESHAKPAGFRTYIIICVASCLLMLISIFIPQTFANFKNGDPGRIASQVVTGIGFLGAGAILRFGVNIKGMTSAATIWAVAAIGMAIGCGFYIAAALAVLLTLFSLYTLEIIEEKVLGWKSYKRLTFICSRKPGVFEKIQSVIGKHNLKIFDWEMAEKLDEQKITYSVVTRIRESQDARKMFGDIGEIEGVLQVKIR